MQYKHFWLALSFFATSNGAFAQSQFQQQQQAQPPQQLLQQAPQQFPSQQAQPPQQFPQQPSLQSLPDYTNKLKLGPGMVILFPVSNSCDQQGMPLNNHNMVIKIEKPKDAAFSFKWTMTEPLHAAGERFVSEDDLRSSHKVSFFYANNQNCAIQGYTNAIRISDAMYQDLKAGQATQFETDGPYAPLHNHHETVPLPHFLNNIGSEIIPVMVDEQRVVVRTIKAQADNGWTYWILDNHEMPMMLRGTGPFFWDTPLLSSDGEGKRIVRDLENKGIATSHLINFDLDSAKLRPASKIILNDIATYLKSSPTVKLEVQGHTCILGGFKYNMDLSQRRAKSVKDYLIAKGIDSSRLTPIGFGYTRPVATNKTNAGRIENRRVVFRTLSK